MSDDPSTRPLVVLQSFPRPRSMTNPYITMLARRLQRSEGVDLRTWTWTGALLGRADVFHAHWPEVLIEGRSPGKQAVRHVLFALFLVKLWLTRTPVVRTVHNLRLPSGITRREVLLLRWLERLTTYRIVLNSSTTLPDDQPGTLIPHGHYRDWFAEHPVAAATPGRVGYFGLIRRYKGVERLVAAFHELPDRSASLRVGGRPSSEELADHLRAAAARDDRISLTLAFLTDAEVVELVTQSQLVVLPYREMHNSGATLACLSVGRPVLVPDNEVNRRLREEVGEGWVQLFDGELTSERLARGLDEAGTLLGGPGAPDLSAREWDGAGRDHVAAYRRAVAIRRGGAPQR